MSVVVGGSPVEWSVGCGVAGVVQVSVFNSSLYILAADLEVKVCQLSRRAEMKHSSEAGSECTQQQ